MSNSIFRALVGAIICLVVWQGWRRRKASNIAAYRPAGLPFVAAAARYAKNPIGTIRNATEECGAIFSIQLLNMSQVWLRGNDLNKVYLETREDVWSFGGGMGIFLNRILDTGFWDNVKPLLGSLSRWLNRAQTLDYIAEITDQEAEKCFRACETKDSFSLFEEVSGIVHRVIVRSLMGQDFYDESADDLLQLLHDIEADIGSLWNMVLPAWVPTLPARRLGAAKERYRTLFDHRLAERALDPERWGNSRDYINHTLNDKATQPLQSLLPSLHNLLMFAAHTSTVASISWTVVSIMRNPEVLDAVQKDLAEDTGLLHARMLQASIRETSRFYAGMANLRLARRNHTIPGTTKVVPAGSLVSMSPYLTHHDPANFPEPDRWRPGRWISAERDLVEIDNKKEAKFVPFGAGTHRCVGEKMAGIVVSRTVALLLRRYHVEFSQDEGSIPFGDLDFARLGTPWLKGDVGLRITRKTK
ncbi:hypothetical protein PG985_014963 [Apiospora marii]|uniref:uncharacterized protein n=1 Tax=Apiospora marii TaxID=335849 RepID=UPI00312D967E